MEILEEDGCADADQVLGGDYGGPGCSWELAEVQRRDVVGSVQARTGIAFRYRSRTEVFDGGNSNFHHCRDRLNSMCTVARPTKNIECYQAVKKKPQEETIS